MTLQLIGVAKKPGGLSSAEVAALIAGGTLPAVFTSINNTPIGGTTKAAGAFTQVTINNPTVSTAFLTVPYLVGHTGIGLIRFMENTPAASTGTYIPLLSFENSASNQRLIMEAIYTGTLNVAFRYRHALGTDGIVFNFENPSNPISIASFSVTTPFSRTNTNEYYGIRFNAAITQTGGGSGITRGIYVNPTLTNAADFRGLDIVNVGAHYAIKTGTGRVSFGDDVDIPSGDAYYIGAPSTDGTWRFVRSGNDLLIERRESGSYVTKSTIAA